MKLKMKPLISVVAIFYNMRREAPRTLFSLSRVYQNLGKHVSYEVLAIDNGSSKPLDADSVRGFGSEFSYHFHDTSSSSPVDAINCGAKMARGKYLVVLIDGARILSPGILSAVHTISPAYEAPFLFTLGLHLGWDIQNRSIREGYNEKVEDRLLRSVAWRRDGYQLFRIAALASSSADGYLGALSESNCYAMRRDRFIDMGGLDNRFKAPGGGLANLDFFSRVCAEPGVQPVMLLGEGTFHQVHGGIATNSPPDRHPMEAFKVEYREVRGWEWEIDESIEPIYFGKLPEAAKQFIGSREASQKFIGPQTGNRPSQCNASCVLVLGMHRSGTSALAKTVASMGFPLPSEPLPPKDTDNAEGYWEPRKAVEINNSFLHTVSQHWASTGPFPPECFTGEDAELHQHEIRCFLRDAIADNRQFLIKDPRLCRLLPLWQPVFEELGIDCTVLIIHRDPARVFQSLARRADDPQIASAAIADPAQAFLLWIRYYIEAEHNSRTFSRHFVSYEHWTADPARYTPEIESFVADTLIAAATKRNALHPRPTADAKAATPTGDLERLAMTVRQKITDSDVSADARIWLDKIHHIAEVQVPELNQPGELPPEATVIINHRKNMSGTMPSNPLDWFSPKRKRKFRRTAERPFIFVSDNPDSRSHIYRVKNPVDALISIGQPALWTTSSELLRCDRLIRDARRIIIHRSEWSPGLSRLVDTCRSCSIPLSFDMDDLLFDPSLATQGQIHFIKGLSQQEQEDWARFSRRLLNTARACGHVICSTQVLAQRATELGLQATVIENGFSPENLEMASHWRAERPTLRDRPRIGYASGTPTHAGDFALIQQTLARWLDANPEWCLTIIGDWDIAPDPSLVDRNQLELRESVNPVNLHYELARLSINLIPLESTRFCESKSPLKWYEAALAGTASIASATARYTELFQNQSLGLVAHNQQDWYDHIDRLAQDSESRDRLADNAREFCREHFHATNIAQRYLTLSSA